MENRIENPSEDKLSSKTSIALEVLNPRGEIAPLPYLGISPRLKDLAGKRIGIYWVGKQGGDHFWDVVEKAIKERVPSASILRYKGPFDLGESMAERLAKECDVFLYGVGD